MKFVDVKNDIAFRKIFGNENKKELTSTIGLKMNYLLTIMPLCESKMNGEKRNWL